MAGFNSAAFQRLGLFPEEVFPAFVKACEIECGYTPACGAVAAPGKVVAVYLPLSWPVIHRKRIASYFRGWLHCRLCWEAAARVEKHQSFFEAVEDASRDGATVNAAFDWRPPDVKA